MLASVPYAFESDMVANLAKSALEAGAASPASIVYYNILSHPDARLRYLHDRRCTDCQA